MENDLSADLIWGVRAIAKEIGRNERQTYHLLAIKALPARRVGAVWVGSRAALREFLTGAAASGHHA